MNSAPDVQGDSVWRLRSDTLAAAFERSIGYVMERDALTQAPRSVASTVTGLVRRDGFDSAAAYELLSLSGVRSRWNDVFARRRSEQVAAWVAGVLTGRGRVIDLMAGDGILTREIAASAGLRIDAFERVDDFSPWLDTDAVTLNVYDSQKPLRPADAVFFGAVLHHEVDPIGLARHALTSGANSYVVIENCIDADFDAELHLALDLFFNRTLNRFGSACVREHRTVDQWSRDLCFLGRLVHVDEMRDVGGLPFPYQLLVFEA